MIRKEFAKKVLGMERTPAEDWLLEQLDELDKYKEENELLKAKLEVYTGALHSEHEAIHRANDLEDDLEKYKRAFEILKYSLEITKTNNIWKQPIIEIRCNMFVTPEQAKLLEEVMRDENSEII